MKDRALFDAEATPCEGRFGRGGHCDGCHAVDPSKVGLRHGATGRIRFEPRQP